MNKLEQVKYSLENNPNVEIANVHEIDRRRNSNLLLNTDMAHVINFNVTPAKDFEIDKFLGENLQLFMKDLTSHLKPDREYNFEQDIITFMENGQEKQALLLKRGYLDFHETLEGGLIPINFSVDYKKQHILLKPNYLREITINPFPSREVAERYKYTTYSGYIRLDLNTELSG
jgi:hypothetical protein